MARGKKCRSPIDRSSVDRLQHIAWKPSAVSGSRDMIARNWFIPFAFVPLTCDSAFTPSRFSACIDSGTGYSRSSIGSGLRIVETIGLLLDVSWPPWHAPSPRPPISSNWGEFGGRFGLSGPRSLTMLHAFLPPKYSLACLAHGLDETRAPR